MNNDYQKILRIQDLCVAYGNNIVLKSLCFAIDKTDWLMVVGPNGAGKSTFIKALSRAVDYSGNIYIEGKEIGSYKQLDYSKKIGFLYQKNDVCFNYLVKDVISMGFYSKSRKENEQNKKFYKNCCEEALLKVMDMLEITHLRDKFINEISGGEMQLVFLAQILVQDPDIIVLDEPLNNLDIAYQQKVMDVLEILRKSYKKTIICIVHDINFAKMYGNKCLLLNKGQSISFGNPEKVLSKNNIQNIYSIDIKKHVQNIKSAWNF